MQLQQQLQAWERQGKWNRIVKALEKLKPVARTKEMNLLLALAYINSLEGEYKTDTFDKMSALIEPLQKEQRNDFSLAYYLTQALFSLKNYEKSKRYYKIAQSGQGYSEEQTDVLAHVYLNSEIEQVLKDALARFRELRQSGPFVPFSVKTQQAWDAFENKQEAFKRNVDEKLSSLSYRQSLIVPLFHEAIKGEKAEIKKEDDKYKIVMTAPGNVLRLFECAYFKNHAPTEILQDWEISVGKAPSLIGPFNEKQQALLDDIKIWIDKEEDGIFSLSMYGTPFRSLREKTGTFAESNLTIDYAIALMSAVGEVVFTKYINWPKPLPEPKNEPSLTLLEFVEYLKEKGIDVHIPTETLLNARTTYNRTPEEMENPFDETPRMDIINGWSKCMRFLQEAKEGRYANMDAIKEDGALVGYLFYFPNIQNEDKKKEEIEALQNSIRQRLLENLSADDFEIIGEAHGERGEYIDIIAWDPKKVLNEAEKVFKDFPVRMSGFNIFEPSSLGIWLTVQDTNAAETE